MIGLETQQQTIIYPRIGRYLIFEEGAGKLLDKNILPIPSDKTKGIILFKSVNNQIIIGPTAEEPDDLKSWEEIETILRDAAYKIIPELKL